MVEQSGEFDYNLASVNIDRPGTVCDRVECDVVGIVKGNSLDNARVGVGTADIDGGIGLDGGLLGLAGIWAAVGIGARVGIRAGVGIGVGIVAGAGKSDRGGVVIAGHGRGIAGRGRSGDRAGGTLCIGQLAPDEDAA